VEWVSVNPDQTVKLHHEFQVGFTGPCGDAGISASKISFGNLQI
jgi:hypothetical protein